MDGAFPIHTDRGTSVVRDYSGAEGPLLIKIKNVLYYALFLSFCRLNKVIDYIERS